MKTPRFGLGFRTQYAEEIARAPSSVDWLEVLSDHYLEVGGPRRRLLEELCRAHPVALHGVGLGVAGSNPLDLRYLGALRELVLRCEPVYVSDHLCWTALDGRPSHDLLPIAYTGDVLGHVAERVSRVQDWIGRPLLLENATAYVAFRGSEMDEAEFLAELCRETGCGVLLDVNNLYVNAVNLGSDPGRALSLLPEQAVGYLHVAGHAVLPDVRIDTHADSVPAEVWQLFAAAAQRFPHADVILERDDDLPPYRQLVAELDEARKRHADALAAPRREIGRPGAAERSSHRRDQDWSSLQRAFWQCVVAPHETAESVDLELFEASLPVAAARGVRVYSDGYLAKLRAALATHFPSLTRVLGSEDWARLSTDYLRAHPPRGHGFVGLGAAFADFVREHCLADDHGVPQCVLAEMAQLEQAQLEAQDAPDPEDIVSPAQLAAVEPAAWESARVELAPSVRIVRVTHDVAPVVHAASRGEAPLRPRVSEQAYLVARRHGGVETEPLEAGDAALVEALLAGRTFGAACAAVRSASGADGAAAAKGAAHWLVRAAAQGWIARVETRV